MRSLVWIFLLLSLAGCSKAVDPEFVSAQKQLETSVIPAYRESFSEGARYLRADTPTGERMAAADRLIADFNRKLTAAETTEAALKKPVDASYNSFRAACEELSLAWRAEVQAYLEFATALKLVDPSKDPGLKRKIMDLQSVAEDRVKATEKAQSEFDSLAKSQQKSLIRPSTVKPFS